jgi:hypothetical protein
MSVLTATSALTGRNFRKTPTKSFVKKLDISTKRGRLRLTIETPIKKEKMKKITKSSKKVAKKTAKVSKVSKVSKVAAPVAPVAMKFATVETLANHIARRLPWARQTGKIYNLRTIKLDSASKGNGVVIWYGCRQMQNFFEFHVDRNMNISYSGIDLNKAAADALIVEISKLLKGNCFNAKANVMLIGNCFVPTLPSLPQVKSESAPAATSEIIINPERLAVLAAPAEAVSQQLEEIEGATAAAAIVAGN